MMVLLLKIILPAMLGLQTGQVLNVHDFGAVGDGEHNDSASIERALEACPVGGSVYIPNGTYIIDPKAQPFYIHSSMTIYGQSEEKSVLMVRDNVEDYEAIFTPKDQSVDTHDVSFHDFKINQNIGHSQSQPTPRVRSKIQFAVRFGQFHNISLDSMSFTQSGSINTASFNGTNSVGATVNNCYFEFVHAPGVPKDYDSSAIYTDCDTAKITNCKFKSTFADMPHTAIEVHGANITVHQCTVNGFRKGINAVSFLPSSAQQNDGKFEITNNTLNVSTTGILLWSLQGRTMHNLDIENNTITVDPSTSPDYVAQGIGMYRDNSALFSGGFDGLVIKGNTINFIGTNDTNEPAKLASHKWSLVDVYGIGLMPAGSVHNADVEGNSIDGALRQGIRVGVVGASDDSSNPRFVNVTVQNNSVTNVAPISGADVTGVDVEGGVTGIAVHNNFTTFANGLKGKVVNVDRAKGDVAIDH